MPRWYLYLGGVDLQHKPHLEEGGVDSKIRVCLDPEGTQFL